MTEDNKTKHIFIGGWANTGTRLICKLLSEKNYNVISHNIAHDYQDQYFRYMFKEIYDSNFVNILPLIDLIKKDTNGFDNWVIKHGHLILMIPELKKEFPESKFIVLIRNPFDMINKGSDLNYKEYGTSNNIDPDLHEKFATIKSWYDKALPHIDHLIRLEDLLYNKEETIIKLYNFLGCNNELSKEILDIIGTPSKTVNQGVLKLQYEKEFEYIYEYAKQFGY